MTYKNSKFPYSVRIPENLIKHNESRVGWCLKHVGNLEKDWTTDVIGEPFVYYFKNEEDALMFKLRFY